MTSELKAIREKFGPETGKMQCESLYWNIPCSYPGKQKHSFTC